MLKNRCFGTVVEPHGAAKELNTTVSLNNNKNTKIILKTEDVN